MSLGCALGKINNNYNGYLASSVDALEYYRHDNTDGSFGGYAPHRAQTRGGADGNISYDDNMWLCNDFLDMAAQTGSKAYIDDARRIADFLINNAYTGIDP